MGLVNVQDSLVCRHKVENALSILIQAHTFAPSTIKRSVQRPYFSAVKGLTDLVLVIDTKISTKRELEDELFPESRENREAVEQDRNDSFTDAGLLPLLTYKGEATHRDFDTLLKDLEESIPGVREGFRKLDFDLLDIAIRKVLELTLSDSQKRLDVLIGKLVG